MPPRAPFRPPALLATLALLAVGAGCNPGHHDIRSGPVSASEICPGDGGTAICPGCSEPDATGVCHDRFYESEIRCLDDDACGGTGHCIGTRCVYHDADGDGFDDALE